MKRMLLAVFTALILVGVHASYAQSPVVIRNTASDETLDEAAIRAAAQPLIARGARVAVYLMGTGGTEDVLTQLRRDGLAQGTTVNADVIAIYVSLEPRYAEIRWGGDWDGSLTQTEADTARLESINPQLRERQFTAAFVQGLTQVEAALNTSNGGNWITNNLFNILLVGWLVGTFLWAWATGKLNSGGGNSDSSSDSSWGGDDSSSDSDGGSSGGDW